MSGPFITSPNTRYDEHGPLRFMAGAENYVMVRRPHAVPFVMGREEYNALPDRPRQGDGK